MESIEILRAIVMKRASQKLKHWNIGDIEEELLYFNKDRYMPYSIV